MDVFIELLRLSLLSRNFLASGFVYGEWVTGGSAWGCSNTLLQDKQKEKHMSQYSNQPNQQGSGMGAGVSPSTGVSNQHFDLVSILYHALQSAQTYDTYIRDAEQRGDTMTAQFFRQIQNEDRNRAQYAMQLLVQRVNQGMSQGAMR